MTMHAYSIGFPTTPKLTAGSSKFDLAFGSLYDQLRDCCFIVDSHNWRPEHLLPQKQKLLRRYQVIATNIGRRLLPVYRGKRFLATFGQVIPGNFAGVYCLDAVPEDKFLRSCSIDGYQLNTPTLMTGATAGFIAFEHNWFFATPHESLVEAWKGDLWAGATIAATPSSLRKLIGLE